MASTGAAVRLTVAASGEAVRQKATTIQLVFMTYAVVCAGAFGLEEMISAAGPGLAVLVLMVFPLLYAAPIALTCSELASRYPVEGGYYRWVRLAFGEFPGYAVAWLLWLTMFATNASFAVLCTNYLRYFVPDLSRLGQFAVSAALIWLAICFNHRGIRVVGSASTILMLLIAVPFAVVTVKGFASWQHNSVSPMVNPDQSLSSALASAFLMAIWLYGGFEKLTVNAGEVAHPSRAFPIALCLGVLLCAASYVLPTAAALSANADWRAWGEAHFVRSAVLIGGPWLGASMAAGGILSNAGIVIAAVLSQSRLPMLLSNDGLFPAGLRRTHPKFGTPTASLLLTGIVLTGFCFLRFAELVGIYALVQSLAYLLIYAALLKLRRTAPPLDRPAFRIPLGRAGLVMMFLPTLLIAGLVVEQRLLPHGRLDIREAALQLLLFGSAPVTYAIARRLGGPLPRGGIFSTISAYRCRGGSTPAQEGQP